jgi:hypothetical protein
MQSEKACIKGEKDNSAKIGEHVVVRCAQFRRRTRLDEKGKWRDAKSQDELPEVLEVMQRFQGAPSLNHLL